MTTRTARNRKATSRPARPPSPSAGADGAAGRAEYEVLRPVVTATCWVDPGKRGTPYASVIKFTGQRAGVTGKPAPADRFERQETIQLVPGSGPVAVTTKVENVNPGEWLVRARRADRHGQETSIDPGRLRGGGRFRRLGTTLWTKGNPVAPGGPGTRVRTRIAALATAPGVITGSWAGFAAAGLAVALIVLSVLLARVHIGVGGALAVALVASLAGAAGARGWYVMLERGKVSGLPVRGLCIQGFIAGAMVAGIPGLLLAGIPVGAFFDAAAPGMFFAMAIGRQGCFFTGCCAGRPTRSRWGIWSSDGRTGARRLPAQQLESLVCLLIGIAALAVFLRFGASASGAVFAGALAAYTLARQGLLAPDAAAAYLGDPQAGCFDVAFGGPVELGAEQSAGQRADQVGEPAEDRVARADVLVEQHLPGGAHHPGGLAQAADRVADRAEQAGGGDGVEARIRVREPFDVGNLQVGLQPGTRRAATGAAEQPLAGAPAAERLHRGRVQVVDRGDPVVDNRLGAAGQLGHGAHLRLRSSGNSSHVASPPSPPAMTPVSFCLPL